MEEDKSALIAELEIGASYASLMSATSLFFTGILISQYKSFNPTIKVPLIYLIISTFSFIFAATIYNNAGSELTLNKLKAVEKYMIYAKSIVELLGLYLFILAVPLIIGAVTQDGFLRTTTIIVAVSGFVLYSQSKFSILEKELSRKRKRSLSLSITVLALLLYYTQVRAVHHSLFIYSFISILLLIIILGSAAAFSLKSKQYKPIMIRTFIDDDSDILSSIILKNLNSAKDKQFSPELIERLKHRSTPAAIHKLAKDETVFVAEVDRKVVGMACLSSNRISMVFTDLGLQRKGIGRALVEKVESKIAQAGYEYLEVNATDIDRAFYKKLGFEHIKEIEDDGSKVSLMRAKIFANLK